MQASDCVQLCFRIPLTAGVQEVQPANSREPDTECATQYVSYAALSSEEDNALITNQDTYTLPRSGRKLQQQPHSSEFTRTWQPMWMECICTISVWDFCILISMSAKSVTVKPNYMLEKGKKKGSTKLYVLHGMSKLSECIIWAHLLQITTAFSILFYFIFFNFKHKRGAVIAKNVNLPPRLKLPSSFSESLRFLLCIVLFWSTFQWTDNGTNFDVR